MAEIRLKDNESLESALRRFKKQCARAGVIAEVRKREAYEKPSVKRKKKSEAAESKRKEKEGALGVFQEACWNQSKTLRPTFDAAIKDLMQSR